MRRLALTVALVACKGPSAETGPPAETGPGPTDTDSDTAAPVVILWTLDTLSARAALDGGLCEHLGGIAAAHGVDLACVPGAVAPASSTLFSHARVLWPTNREGDNRATGKPDCDNPSVLGLLADALDAGFVWAPDNPVFEIKASPCEGTDNGWWREADAVFALDALDTHNTAEEERPAHLGVNEIVARAARGEPVVAFLNDYEVGGHLPRCWYDPDHEACAALVQLAIDGGLATAKDDPVDLWLDSRFFDALAALVSDLPPDQAPGGRALMMSSIVRQVQYYGEARTGARLETLLAGLEAAGALERLALVIVGDHGETPCVADPVDGVIHCKHGGPPSEWTAQVPAYFAPASLAESFVAYQRIATDGTWWSTTGLPYALLEHHGVPVPAAWPPAEPLGTATAWECGDEPGGVHVIGDEALRCSAGACGAFTWALPVDPERAIAPVTPIPAELEPWADAGGTDWFSAACR